MRKLTFTTGLVMGYVLGTRAGRGRYEQITKIVRAVHGRPAAVKARSGAKGMISEGVGAVTAKIGYDAGSENAPVIDGTA